MRALESSTVYSYGGYVSKDTFIRRPTFQMYYEATFRRAGARPHGIVNDGIVLRANHPEIWIPFTID